ncbi:hypothetical protein BS78_05G101700 [Paspalum vaginatum]|nr:hypothetical protein BS78_05G101700 [Paspalum vaginatum]
MGIAVWTTGHWLLVFRGARSEQSDHQPPIHRPRNRPLVGGDGTEVSASSKLNSPEAQPCRSSQQLSCCSAKWISFGEH